MIKQNYVQGEYRSRIMSFGNSRKIEQKYKNKRGSSYDELKEKRIELNEAEPISSIITQIQKQPQLPSSNERCFSYSPKGNHVRDKLLPPLLKQHLNRKTLVLDLDETLVHSGFKPFNPSDIILKIEFEGVLHEIHVLVRPGVEEFLKRMSAKYEIVIFTASLAKYANPLLDILDPQGYCTHRLFREHCTMINNIFVKDLKRLNRELKNIIIVDNSPISYVFNQENGFPVESWYFDKNDTELDEICPILEFLSNVNDIRLYLPQMISNQKIDSDKMGSVLDNYNQALHIQKKLEEKKQGIDSSRLQNATPPNDLKGININIVTNNYNNFFISNNSINAKDTPSGRDPKKIKSLNLFRNSNNTGTNCSNIASPEPKTSKNAANFNLKALEKANSIMNQSIPCNDKRISKYSSLLDKKHPAKTIQSSKGAQTTEDTKSKNHTVKTQLNPSSPLQVMIIPNSPSNFSLSNINLIRPNSSTNLGSITSNKKKHSDLISNAAFPRPKSSANIIAGFIPKTPKMPIKKKGMTTPLDDIFIKRRISSTSRHNKLKSSLPFHSVNLGKKSALLI